MSEQSALIEWSFSRVTEHKDPKTLFIVLTRKAPSTINKESESYEYLIKFSTLFNFDEFGVILVSGNALIENSICVSKGEKTEASRTMTYYPPIHGEHDLITASIILETISQQLSHRDLSDLISIYQNSFKFPNPIDNWNGKLDSFLLSQLVETNYERENYSQDSDQM